MTDDIRPETECNPDCVYVPATGWWCRCCGVFTEVDDDDLCADCRKRAVAAVADESRRRHSGRTR